MKWEIKEIGCGRYEYEYKPPKPLDSVETYILFSSASMLFLLTMAIIFN